MADAWKTLYRIAAVATAVMVLFFLFDVIVWITLGPCPRHAEGWFTLLQSNRLAGLLLLSFPTVFGMMLYYLTFFGLYGTLRAVNEAWAALAALFAFVGLAILPATNAVCPIVHLSDQYAAATTEPQRTVWLAGGEAQIATVGAGMNMGLLAEGAAVIFSVFVLRSSV